MHIPELTLETYSSPHPKGWTYLSVGWLGDTIPSSCPPEKRVLDFLRSLPVVHKYRGYHGCGVCMKPLFDEEPIPMISGNARDWMDQQRRLEEVYSSEEYKNLPKTQMNGEFFIESESGKIRYVLPVGVIHYIEHHHYRLPDEVYECIP